MYQAELFDGTFSGRADFLVRTDDGYAVYDTKLARHAKVTAVLQLAAYADQLQRAGITVAPEAHLVLGDRTTSTHRIDDIVPLLRFRRSRVEALVEQHMRATEPIAWGAPGITACGRCDTCQEEVAAHRDVLLVANLSTVQRARLNAAGIETIDDLAASDGPVPGISGGTLATLRAQARLQVIQSPPDGDAPTLPDGRPRITVDVFAPEALRRLPRPDAGDIYFDFEGDPLWAEDGSVDWGLEYLFGLVTEPSSKDDEPPFVPIWAHDRAQEKKALERFLALVVERRAQHPGMHVYHYAPYETTALKRLVGRHGIGEDVLDDLLRSGVFVDLYAIVRASLRTSQPSYSIKYLEPLYTPTARAGVTNAQDSITEYAEACRLRDTGDTDGFEAKLDEIGAYNRDDCISTRRLRDWLLARAAEHGVHPTAGSASAPDDGATTAQPAPSELALRIQAAQAALLAHVRDDVARPDRTPDEQALAMLAAAMDYHRREERPAWWEHFDRLATPVDEWTSRSAFRPAETTPGVLEVHAADWQAPVKPKRTWCRTLTVVGQLEPGTDLTEGTTVWPVYRGPAGDGMKGSATGDLVWNPSGAKVLEIRSDGEQTTLVLAESCPGGQSGWTALPVALAPSITSLGKPLATAITDLAERVVQSLGSPDAGGPELPPLAMLDLLRRVPPRLREGAAWPTEEEREHDPIAAITRTVRTLDGSYLAVQGPPGTGKTHTGSHVIAELVAAGWKVGVVAQSHAVVENMLRAVQKAGVDPDQIAKKPPTDQPVEDGADHPWVPLKDEKTFAGFFARHDATGTGYVVGGTAWDFASPRKLPDGGYDLLVVDEAGQFALANTLAVAQAARNVMLLGDPQQLPQVSQGVHPEPVETSALGWLMGDHTTLPDHLGFFLAESWRMHPAVCDAVSRLSYDGRLTSRPGVAETRSLDGVEPGVRTVLVEHHGNATVSDAEADEVVAQVAAVVGRRWQDPAAKTPEDRPLAAADVLVVAAYNAQVAAIRHRLDRAGFRDTRVGTVDKFQGREAPVAIVSFAASSGAEVPRGIGFLLNRNRVNVAVSRAKHHAVIVRSPALVDHLPTTPAGVAELGAFLGLSPQG
ncbi:TM0106 family RecB-like putative nuclease [Flavimobilis soli]|uniref:TM0106 family RecB-like putative nuclease n=1 Tax=Flavimobilis soli TaxID=442709 RepID=UPI001FE90F85|nr:bifunctional RecB family nuclease/DEAD/DEAH box helicase [Flavimobilis soli]